MDKNNTLLYHDYTSFSCTGSECPDNCCRVSTWSINLDKDTYQAFKELDDEFARVVIDSVEYDEKNDTYKFKSGETDGYCKMLDNEGLCEIHKRYGADYLSDTCIQYPRTISIFNGMMEWSLSNSCPIVVDLFILKGKLNFQSVRVEGINTGVKEPKESIANRIRRVSIEVLQYPNLSLYDRLLWLNIIFRKLSEHSFSEQSEADIYRILEMYKSEPPTSDILDVFKKRIKNIPSDTLEYLYTYWWKVLKSYIFTEKNPGNKELHEKVEQFSNKDITYFIGKTISLKEKLLREFIAKNEQIFENYLVKELFDTKFPILFNDFESAYITIMSNYVLLQLFILALNFDKEELSLEDIRNAIYYFHRRATHVGELKKALAEYCKVEKNINWATLAAILY